MREQLRSGGRVFGRRFRSRLTQGILGPCFLNMESPLRPGPRQAPRHGPGPDKSLEYPKGSRSQWNVLTFQNQRPATPRVNMPHLAYSLKIKHFLKTSVVQMEERLLKRLFGRSRDVITKIEKEFQILLHVGKLDSAGKVEILIKGKGWYRKRAQRLLSLLASKSEGQNKLQDILMLSLTNKSKRPNSHSTAFFSDPAMTGLNVAMQSLELSHDTAQDTANKDDETT